MWLPARGLLAALLFSAFASPSAAAGHDAIGLDDLKWIDPAANRVAALTRAPSECLVRPSAPELASQVALGRIAFRSPVLLGGIAARSGMSCNTCHRNGHDNPTFFVAGVSGVAGTVDVTGGLFSRTRDDGDFNPVPIPSLVDAASKSSFGSIVPKDDLRAFVMAVVMDEFQGPLPPDAVTEGLLAYLRALRSSACPKLANGLANGPADEPADEMVSLERDALDLETAYDTILWGLKRHDVPTADFALLALRAALGRIHQRFSTSERAADGLLEVSLALTAIRSMLETRPVEASQALDQTRDRLRRVIRDLHGKSSKSFYNPALLGPLLLDAH